MKISYNNRVENHKLKVHQINQIEKQTILHKSKLKSNKYAPAPFVDEMEFI